MGRPVRRPGGRAVEWLGGRDQDFGAGSAMRASRSATRRSWKRRFERAALSRSSRVRLSVVSWRTRCLRVVFSVVIRWMAPSVHSACSRLSGRGVRRSECAGRFLGLAAANLAGAPAGRVLTPLGIRTRHRIRLPSRLASPTSLCRSPGRRERRVVRSRSHGRRRTASRRSRLRGDSPRRGRTG